jgi:hypothetical protein
MTQHKRSNQVQNYNSKMVPESISDFRESGSVRRKCGGTRAEKYC